VRRHHPGSDRDRLRQAIVAARRGDNGASAYLYVRYADDLVRSMERHGASRDEAARAAADAFRARAVVDYSDDERFDDWLRRRAAALARRPAHH
jgi:hypothetical protein